MRAPFIWSSKQLLFFHLHMHWSLLRFILWILWKAQVGSWFWNKKRSYAINQKQLRIIVVRMHSKWFCQSSRPHGVVCEWVSLSSILVGPKYTSSGTSSLLALVTYIWLRATFLYTQAQKRRPTSSGILHWHISKVEEVKLRSSLSFQRPVGGRVMQGRRVFNEGIFVVCKSYRTTTADQFT